MMYKLKLNGREIKVSDLETPERSKLSNTDLDTLQFLNTFKEFEGFDELEGWDELWCGKKDMPTLCTPKEGVLLLVNRWEANYLLFLPWAFLKELAAVESPEETPMVPYVSVRV